MIRNGVKIVRRRFLGTNDKFRHVEVAKREMDVGLTLLEPRAVIISGQHNKGGGKEQFVEKNKRKNEMEQLTAK